MPGVPQTTHKLELLQRVFASLQTEPLQQGCPAPPQVMQVPLLLPIELLQAVPASRQAVPDEQQGCPVPPHNLHR